MAITFYNMLKETRSFPHPQPWAPLWFENSAHAKGHGLSWQCQTSGTKWYKVIQSDTWTEDTSNVVPTHLIARSLCRINSSSLTIPHRVTCSAVNTRSVYQRATHQFRQDTRFTEPGQLGVSPWSSYDFPDSNAWSQCLRPFQDYSGPGPQT